MMIRYARFILPFGLIGGAALTYVCARLMAKRNCAKRERQQQAVVADWEDEGGSVTPVSAREP